jgi:kynurenine formamidase
MEFRDLSIPVDEDTTVPPGLPSFRQGGVVRNDESHGYESDYMTTTLHVGTHLDAPYHFDPDGRTIAELDLEELVRPTKRVDIRGGGWDDPETKIPLDPIEEALTSPIEQDDYLFIHTGWADKCIDDPKYYLESPYYDPEVSEFVVESGAKGLITDTPIDSGDHGMPNHFTLCENDRVIVENVANLEGLPDEFTTWVVPMNLANGEGAPARVFLVDE